MKGNNEFRPYHYLRPLLRTTTPASLIFADTETFPVKVPELHRTVRHHLRLWCAKAIRYEDGKESRVQWGSGNTAGNFWSFVHSRADNKRPVWIFFHNAGFDLTILNFWQCAIEGDFEFKQFPKKPRKNKKGEPMPSWVGAAVLNDPPTILKFRSPGTTKTFIVVDTFNYFRTSLDEIGKSIGHRKGKRPPYSAPNRVWLDYCTGDVKTLEKAVLTLLDLVRTENLGDFAYTIASQAMNAFRSRFMPTETPILIHGNKEAIDLERESYHGGAVHCWYVGKVCKSNQSHTHKGERGKDIPCLPSPVYVLDVQSFYPSIMATQHFPYRLDKVYFGPTWDQFQTAMAGQGVIAAVTLECSPPGFPVTREGRTYYAAGRIKTVLCKPELERALQENAIASVWAMATYKTAPIFNEFVNYFFRLRKEYEASGNDAFAYACKLMLNSLYGKFGQRRFRWENKPGVIPPIPFGYWWERPKDSPEFKCYRALCWLPQLQQEAGEHIDSFPAIAAYVTSYGRERILKLASVAGIENCYYSDTDSLHVNREGFVRLTSDDEICEGTLGKLRIVETAQRAEYRGYKDYSLNGREVIAGIKADAKKKAKGKYQQTQFQRLASILEGNELDSVAVQVITIPKGDRTPIGAIGDDGRVQIPLLSEW